MGYTSRQQILMDNSTDANFRSWGSSISAQLLAVGWSQTADTGQVNWTTVTHPSVSNTYAGYEIWQPTDALQTGATVFYLKLEYGNGTNSSNSPAVRMSVGTGTNGSGTLTGFVTNTGANVGSSGTGSTTYDCLFSGDTDRLGFMMWRTSGVGIAVAVERTKSTLGADSSDGVSLMMVIGLGVAGGGFSQTIAFGVGLGPQTLGNVIKTGINTTLVLNSNVAISPYFPSYGKFGNPHTVLGVSNNVDVLEGMLISVQLYGSTRLYFASKASNALAGNGAVATLMRYD